MAKNKHAQEDHDALIALCKDMKQALALLEKQNGRIGKLERWRTIMTVGLALILGSVLPKGVLLSLLGTF